MAENIKVKYTIGLDIKLSLWTAIKLRIAGKKYYKLFMKSIKNVNTNFKD